VYDSLLTWIDTSLTGYKSTFSNASNKYHIYQWILSIILLIVGLFCYLIALFSPVLTWRDMGLIDGEPKVYTLWDLLKTSIVRVLYYSITLGMSIYAILGTAINRSKKIRSYGFASTISAFFVIVLLELKDVGLNWDDYGSIETNWEIGYKLIWLGMVFTFAGSLLAVSLDPSDHKSLSIERAITIIKDAPEKIFKSSPTANYKIRIESQLMLVKNNITDGNSEQAISILKDKILTKVNGTDDNWIIDSEINSQFILVIEDLIRNTKKSTNQYIN
jgi:hypothetical protein